MGIAYRLQLRPEARYTHVGPLLEEVTGFSPEQYLADPGLHRSRVAREDLPLIDLKCSTHPSATRGRITYRMRRRDGTWIWLEDHYQPERDDTGAVVAVSGLALDVSARHELEQMREAALERERDAAERLRDAVAMQRSFLQAISHEFRTPLTVVLGFARTLRTHLPDLEPARVEQLLDRLVGNAERLDELLTGLLDLERISRGVARAHLRPTELSALCHRVVEQLSITDHAITLDLEPAPLDADVAKIERVVESLLHNAARHTPAGTSVWLRTRRFDDRATITVEDDGPGVPPEIVDRLFEPFSQGLQAAESPSPGTGIGLAIVARYAELHGGRAWYEERPGGGARFTVELATASASEEHARSGETRHASRRAG